VLVLLTQRAHCAGPDYRAALLKHTARRNGQEFIAATSRNRVPRPTISGKLVKKTSLTVFRTDNKSWSSCGAERTQPSEAHRRYPATRIAEPSRKPLPLASPDHLRKSMV